MTDLNDILDTKGSDFKRPPLAPTGTYLCTIQKREFGKSSKKQTPYVRYTYINPIPQDDIEPEDLADIDLSKRTFRDDFYLTEDATYRVREHGEICGVDPDLSIREIIEEVVAKQVLVSVVQVPSMREGSDDMYNEVRGYAAVE
jgi:hypothetical protein